MEYKIWYSVENCGDGSAYPKFCESEELAEIHQEYLDEGWGEPCVGFVMVESESPIIIRGVLTVDKMIEKAEEEITNKYWKKWQIDNSREKLTKLKKLREKPK